MDLRELMEFLQRMAESNLERHLKEAEDLTDLQEIGYHQGQLSVLDVLIPRTPKGVEPLKGPENE